MNSNLKQVSYGSIVFTRAEICFINAVRKKGVVCIYGTCSGKEMDPIKVSVVLDDSNCYCSACGKEITNAKTKTKITITNYLPTSNDLIIRIEIECECETENSFIIMFSLAN